MDSPKTSSSMKYNGDIVAGSLIPRETRKIAELLLKGIDGEEWRKVIVSDNILQKRNPVAAKRQALLIRERLELAKPELWKMICEGGPDLSIQANLAAAIKHSRLLGDFMESVVKSPLADLRKEDRGEGLGVLSGFLRPGGTENRQMDGRNKIYPLLRSHNLLNNLHSLMGDTPLVMFYPGIYTGQGMKLFGMLKETNYYRTFQLVV